MENVRKVKNCINVYCCFTVQFYPLLVGSLFCLTQVISLNVIVGFEIIWFTFMFIQK
jgi:hypothetical protein